MTTFIERLEKGELMNSEACGSWLPLTEYSAKYKISMSTLRRRIKAEDIRFRFDEGKYLIIDEPMGTHQRLISPSLDSDLALVGSHNGLMTGSNDGGSDSHNEEPMISTADNLLLELKKAYSKILQEKELQILQLREEVGKLKSSIRILELDNKRFKEADK